MLVLLDILHPGDWAIRSLVTCGMALRPFLQLAPIATLSVLTHSGYSIELTLDGSRSIISITQDLAPQGVKAMCNMMPLSALLVPSSVLVKRYIYYFLSKISP